MFWKKMLMSAILAGFLAAPVLAQDAAERGPRDRGDRGDRMDRGGDRGGRQFDPQQARQRMLDALKEQLGASDEEWKVLQPKIERVSNAQRATRGGGLGAWAGRGPGGAGGPGGQTGPGAAREQDSEIAIASRELRAAIQSDASEQEINQRLAAYRDARKKAETELEAARADLRDLLTPRQEAVLVMAGMLE